MCRCPPRDGILVQCDRCKVPFVDEASLKISLSADELRHVAGDILRSWKFWVPLCVGMLAAAWLALQIVDYLTGRKVQDVIGNIQTSVSNSLVEANTMMTNDIAQRFKEPHIQNLMENVASAQAQKIITDQIAPIVDSFKKTTQEHLEEIKETKQRVLSLETELKSVAKLAKSPTLKLNATQVNRTDKGLEVLLQFKSSKDVGLGKLDFVVKIVNVCDTKILSGEPSGAHHGYIGGPAHVADDGKQASFNFGLIGGVGHPTLKLLLSGEALLHITGSKLEELATYYVTEKKPNK